MSMDHSRCTVQQDLNPIQRRQRTLLWCVLVMLATVRWISPAIAAEGPGPLTDAQRQSILERHTSLQAELNQQPEPHSVAWDQAAAWLKGLEWGLRFQTVYSPAEKALLDRALLRGRLPETTADKSETKFHPGRQVGGYRSRIDGSIQPYGLIVPAKYDPARPIRLDVVLHGSTRPIGMSELNFLARFDGADGRPDMAPDVEWIELHPLGRVENCYRWSGETDVFEAIEDVCRKWNIDRERIVLRGMSMGASGTWHLGLKHPDRFVALGPYCGYVDTHRFSETPLPNFVRVGPLPPHQELGLHLLDSVDYAANVSMVPAIACMGEKDIFFQAHVIMAEAMRQEGLTLTNLISPGTGHVIDPLTHAEQLSRIAGHVQAGRRPPRDLRFVTWTLKYNRCYWLELLELEQHYARAEFRAQQQGRVLHLFEPVNIRALAIHRGPWLQDVETIRIGGMPVTLPPRTDGATERFVFRKAGGVWQQSTEAMPDPVLRKRPGLQGPIDDAFTRPFLCVRGTRAPWNRSAQTYADAALDRFRREWEQYFRGELPVKNDTDVTDEDVRTRNLILFGDPGSNLWIERVLPRLPLQWDSAKLTVAGTSYASADHLPALISPNPLAGGPGNYIVLNSGHTFRGAELGKLNYLLFPRWGDWAVVKAQRPFHPEGNWEDEVVQAGYSDEQWQIAVPGK